jgi:hypothetical protein
MVPATSKRIVPGRARLVGTHRTACSRRQASGARWCAFSVGSVPFGSTELWVIDVTKAAGPGAVTCTGSDPACLRLTRTLWTGSPAAGPFHPYAHHFTGDTLIFYAGGPLDEHAYHGPIFAWRPGWAEARQITGPQGGECFGHPTADVAYCLENLLVTATRFEYDLHAGRLGTAPLPLAAKVFPLSTPAESLQFRAAFSPAGDYFAFSTGGATAAEPETLYVTRPDDVAFPDRRTPVGAGISQWQIAADAQHWYFLRDYNYPSTKNNVDPSGTLTRADFPSGANATPLAPRVGRFDLLDEAGADRGLVYIDAVTGGRGDYKILRDPAKPAGAATLATGVFDAEVSPDLRYSLIRTQANATTRITDAQIIKNDGTGRCTLSTEMDDTARGVSFLAHSGLVLWPEKRNPTTLAAEGWLANPDGCKDKVKYGDAVDFWFTAADRAILYGDMARVDVSASLRLARLTAAPPWLAGPPTAIGDNGAPVYAPLLPELDYVVYQVPEDGLYIYGPIQ